jgi:hypothetical protein
MDDDSPAVDEEWTADEPFDIDTEDRQTHFAPDPDEVVEPGNIDHENAIFVVLGVLAMVVLFVHILNLLA